MVEACRPLAGEVVLVLVPRHMERRDAVVGELSGLGGLEVVQRSRMEEGGARSRFTGAGLPVLLLDTTGELASMYAVADVVFVGKSLPPNRGGQNMVVPAAAGVALVVGPHTENFPGVMDILREAGAVIEVCDAAELALRVAELVGAVDMRAEQGGRAREVVRAQRGVTARTLDLLQPLIEADDCCGAGG